MHKTTSFIGFLTICTLICLLSFSCTKKKDTVKPAEPNAVSQSNVPASPAESNTPSEFASLPAHQAAASQRITAPDVNDSNKPELIKEAEKQTPFGVITAIAYSDRPSVLIGSELLSQGDTIRGVKIIKISREAVEFEKNGSTWTQQAGDPPNSHWSDPNS